MLTLLRTVLGAVFLSLLWACFVLLCSYKTELAVGAFFATLVVLPVVVPSVAFFWLRVSGKIRRVAWVNAPRLRSKVLHRVLEGGDAPMSLMCVALGKTDCSFFYISLPIFAQGRLEMRRILLVSESWLNDWESSAESEDGLEQELDFVLERMGEGRWPLLRSFQLCLWIGQVFLLEIALHILGTIFRILGFRHMPSPVFFCQNVAWSLKRLWFAADGNATGFWDTRGLTPRVSTPPVSWNSLCIGVWGLYPVRHLHPSWRFFVDSDGIIPS